MSQSVRTHKESQNLAADYSHDWPVSSVPRRAEFYEPVPPETPSGWSHFVDMKKSRHIPDEVIRFTIEQGNVFKAEDDNRYRFLWTEPGTGRTFSLIVELRAEAFAYESANHYCVTIYHMEH